MKQAHILSHHADIEHRVAERFRTESPPGPNVTRKLPVAGESMDCTQPAVWVLVALMTALSVAGLYLVWAKLAGAWPFAL
jgi:hypothetical protein